MMDCIDKKSFLLEPYQNVSAAVGTSNIEITGNAIVIKKIGIIGGGWFGCHVGLAFRKKYPFLEVSIFEKNEKLFNEISGNYGIRLHAGPHYPRSAATRQGCRSGFKEFMNCYNELINEHEYSIYGLGNWDSNGEPSKVDAEHFASVCKEFKMSHEIDLSQWNFNNLVYGVDINEPSIVVGERLKNYFSQHLTNHGVKIFYSTRVADVRKISTGKIQVTTSDHVTTTFDSVINSTGFTSVLPNPLTDLPLHMKMIFQIRAALFYEYCGKSISNKPFSFTVMDGMFPGIMPYDDRASKDKKIKKYMVLHSKWTTLGSYNSYEEANKSLKEMNTDIVKQEVKLHCEKYLSMFLPDFCENFRYLSWKTTILAKIENDKEFRGAVTFQDTRNDLIYIIPGKINNIFDAEREVLSLTGIKSSDKVIIHDGNWRYTEEGALLGAAQEITEKPFERKHNCGLRESNDIPLRRKSSFS